MGIVKYIVRVWIDLTKGSDFVYKGSTFRVSSSSVHNKEVYVNIPTKSNNSVGSMGWENDMINTFLDSLKGTDMKIVNRIEY